ncbi:threonine/homoserine/homoserine lactone efflux protein [Maribacter polysiphoniae]|uniref:Threonine/homoserine/homoserine lactone efflux protein n=1 Tax=Maribacter polysiphoniae TaxID=429344 RepID=A0A316E3W3_9FLAO|nr:threonine/homoserine/homoserine lactone efflux protein [Maribacter polysiphoniae]
MPLNYDILSTFIIASAALAIAPGPDVIYVLMQSIVNGKKYGMATAAGLVSGCLVHTSLLAFGVSAVIKESDLVFFLIKLFGALYLFYLAYRVFKSDAQLQLASVELPKNGFFKLFKQGFLMNVLNPKVAIFYLAFFPGFLFSDTLSTVVQFYVLGLIFMLVAFVIFSFIAVLSGAISKYITGHSSLGFVLKWLQVVVFIGIGLFILLSNK